LNGLPEGVELVEVAAEAQLSDLPVYYWADGIRGGRGILLGRGAIRIEPSKGYEFKYDVINDEYRAVRTFASAKILTLRFRVTDEIQENRLRRAANGSEGFLSIEEEAEPAATAAH
jgi:hypothetical protein